MRNNKGQSGLQVLMFISMIFFVVVFIGVFILNAQKGARDAERMTALQNTQKALDLYYDATSHWPEGYDDGYGWDEGFHSPQDKKFIQPLVDKNFLLFPPGDPQFYGAKAFKYKVYDAGYAGCPTERGKFYVLGITELESDTRPPQKYTGSGFACSGRDWQKEFDYVVGKFEK